MSHKRTQPSYLSNVVLEGSKVDPRTGIVVGAGNFVYTPMLTGLKMADFSAPAGTEFTITDTGGAGGGFYTIPLGTLPNTGSVLIYQALAELAVSGVSGGIVATAALVLGVGTVATADATLGTTEKNYTPAGGSGSLVAGAGTITAINVTPTPLPGGSAVHLNIGVADAGITADGALTASLLVRLGFLELRGN